MDNLQRLQRIRQSLQHDSIEDAELQHELLLEARGLVLDLERPANVVERIYYQSLETAVTYTAIRMGLFEALNEFVIATAEDLAKVCSADITLVVRILRFLVSHGTIKQIGLNSYSPSTASYTLADPINQAAIECSFNIMSRGWLSLPEFLEERKWSNPTSLTKTPLAKGFNRPEGASLYDVLENHPSQQAFNLRMKNFSLGRRDWLDFYPVLDRVGDGADQNPSSVTMVDVGGGNGHQALNFARKFPQLPGRVVVQDRPQGFPPVRSPEIEWMEHDFNQEQPIKGARLYYMRHVAHDYPQEYLIGLCTRIRKAMKPGYSRLIIVEWIIPPVNPSKMMTILDCHMMTIGGGMERTLAQHQDYLERAGLRIKKVYSPGDRISESVIEAEVA